MADGLDLSRPSRREAILLLSAATVGLAGGGLACAPPPAGDQAEALLAFARSRDPWLALGQAIREGGGAVEGVESLTRSLLDALGWRRVPGAVDEVVAALAERIRRDYEEGRTEEVAGWILSRTEGDLGRLASAVSESGTPGDGSPLG